MASLAAMVEGVEAGSSCLPRELCMCTPLLCWPQCLPLLAPWSLEFTLHSRVTHKNSSVVSEPLIAAATAASPAPAPLKVGSAWKSLVPAGMTDSEFITAGRKGTAYLTRQLPGISSCHSVTKPVWTVWIVCCLHMHVSSSQTTHIVQSNVSSGDNSIQFDERQEGRAQSLGGRGGGGGMRHVAGLGFNIHDGACLQRPKLDMIVCCRPMLTRSQEDYTMYLLYGLLGD